MIHSYKKINFLQCIVLEVHLHAQTAKLSSRQNGLGVGSDQGQKYPKLFYFMIVIIIIIKHNYIIIV